MKRHSVLNRFTSFNKHSFSSGHLHINKHSKVMESMWEDEEIKVKNMEIIKLKAQNKVLQKKLKDIGDIVTKMVYKFKIKNNIKPTEVHPSYKDLEWLERTALTYEKEREQLKQRLSINTNNEHILELEIKLNLKRIALERAKKEVKDKRRKLKWKEKELSNIQTENTNNNLLSKLEFERITKEFYAVHEKTKLLEAQIESNNTNNQKKKNIIEGLTLQVNRLNNETEGKHIKLKITKFISNKLINKLKTEYKTLKNDYTTELKANIKERAKVTEEIKRIKKLLKPTSFNKIKESVPELRSKTDLLAKHKVRSLGRNSFCHHRVITKNTWTTLAS